MAAAEQQWLAALHQVKQLHGLAAPPAPPAGQTDGYFPVESIIPTSELSDTQWKRLIKAKASARCCPALCLGLDLVMLMQDFVSSQTAATCLQHGSCWRFSFFFAWGALRRCCRCF